MNRIYYGWYLVALSAVVYMLVIGATNHAYGLYVVPVSVDFELSRATANTGLILMAAGGALWSPLIGRLLDKFSIKRIMAFFGLLLGISLVGLGLSRSLWLNALIMFGPLAAAVQGAGVLTVTVLIARWFTVHRGRAMALAVTGMSLGGILVTPLVGYSIAMQGWRITLVTSGCVLGLLLLLVSLMVRDRPGPDDREVRSSEAAPARTATLPGPRPIKDILSQPSFWLIGISCGSYMGIAQALVVSLVPLALDSGITIVQATALISILSVASICAQLVLAGFADKMDRTYLLIAAMLLMAVLNFVFMVVDGYATLVVGSITLGFATGLFVPTFYALLADRFGAASFGTVRGMMAPIVAVIVAAMVRLAGEVFDRTSSYHLLFVVFGVVLLAAAAMLLPTRRKEPALA